MKKNLRAQKLLERLNHHPDEKKIKDDKLLKILSKTPQFKKAKKVLFYLPIHKEVDLVNMFEKYKKSKKFALPKVAGKHRLHLHYIRDLSETENGRFNILEPKGHLKEAKSEEFDLILVPGIVFSKDGHRIGYGKGFYDRMLKKTTCPKFGIAYGFQIVENIQGEKHDVPMDYIATEKGIIQIKHT